MEFTEYLSVGWLLQLQDLDSLVLSSTLISLRTPTAASQLLHSVKQLCDRSAQPGAQLQSTAHIYTVPPKSDCCCRTYRGSGIQSSDLPEKQCRGSETSVDLMHSLFWLWNPWLMDRSLLSDREDRAFNCAYLAVCGSLDYSWHDAASSRLFCSVCIFVSLNCSWIIIHIDGATRKHCCSRERSDQDQWSSTSVVTTHIFVWTPRWLKNVSLWVSE